MGRTIASIVPASAGSAELARAEEVPDIRRVMSRAKAIEEEARIVRTRLAAIAGDPDDIEALRDIGAEWAGVRIEAAAKGYEIVAAGRDRGEVKRHGDNQRTPHRAGSSSLAELGLTSQELARWHAVADVDYQKRQRYIDWAKGQDGRDGEITIAGLMRFAKEPDPVIDPPDLPEGKFRCIVIDPPWPMKKLERENVRVRQGEHLDYPVMSLQEIGDLPVADLCDEEGTHVYLWVTHKFLPAGLELFEKWGVKYQCEMTWVKNVGITPFSWMYDTEHVLFGRVGSLDLMRNGLRLSFEAPVTGHSRKPDVFYERVLAASPGPRLEMFARQQREGFVAWGNEVAELVG